MSWILITSKVSHKVS